MEKDLKVPLPLLDPKNLGVPLKLSESMTIRVPNYSTMPRDLESGEFKDIKATGHSGGDHNEIFKNKFKVKKIYFDIHNNVYGLLAPGQWKLPFHLSGHFKAIEDPVDGGNGQPPVAAKRYTQRDMYTTVGWSLLVMIIVLSLYLFLVAWELMDIYTEVKQLKGMLVAANNATVTGV